MTDDGDGSGQPGSISSGLLGRVKARQPEAWRQLVRLFGPVVYGWCRHSGLQPADAGDVTQETFRAVMTGVQNFRRDRPGDSFRGWLWTITRSKVQDHFRRRQGRPAAEGGTDAQQQMQQIPDHPPESSTTRPSASVGSSPAHRGLEQVRAEFEDRTWQAFWRTAVDQQPATAVADELGMTPAAVYKAKSRIMRRIRQELGDLLEG
jgi:RNA polymerase sigma-70 factor (ECF subfamily)